MDAPLDQRVAAEDIGTAALRFCELTGSSDIAEARNAYAVYCLPDSKLPPDRELIARRLEALFNSAGRWDDRGDWWHREYLPSVGLSQEMIEEAADLMPLMESVIDDGWTLIRGWQRQARPSDSAITSCGQRRPRPSSPRARSRAKRAAGCRRRGSKRTNSSRRGDPDPEPSSQSAHAVPPVQLVPVGGRFSLVRLLAGFGHLVKGAWS